MNDENKSMCRCPNCDHTFETKGNTYWIGFKRKQTLGKTPEQAFRFYIKQGLSDTECWPWEGQVSKQGLPTPVISIGSSWKGTLKKIPAKRYSLQSHGRQVPKRARIRNTCGNNLCVNPDHLSYNWTQVHHLKHRVTS